MRRAFIIGQLKNKITVCESDIPDTIIISIDETSIELTKEQWRELMSLEYKVDITPQPFQEEEN